MYTTLGGKPPSTPSIWHFFINCIRRVILSIYTLSHRHLLPPLVSLFFLLSPTTTVTATVASVHTNYHVFTILSSLAASSHNLCTSLLRRLCFPPSSVRWQNPSTTVVAALTLKSHRFRRTPQI